MAKVHIGLVAETRELEPEIKQASEQLGGCYLHHSRSVLELAQKAAFDKAQLIILDFPAKTEGSELSSLLSFVRSKKELHKLPILLLTSKNQLEVPFLLLDLNLRSFPKSGGLFVPLLSISPLLNSENPVTSTFSRQWIESEFLRSLSSQVGQKTEFSVQVPTLKEQKRPFFAQRTEEVRTHLGWFKFTIRMLQQESDGLAQLFKGMSGEMIEEVAEVLVTRVMTDFKLKAENDLSTRGAVYLPASDKLTPAERNSLLTKVKNFGVLYSSPDCEVLLEVSQYI